MGPEGDGPSVPMEKSGIFRTTFANPSEWNFALPSTWKLMKFLFGCYEDSSKLPNQEVLEERLPIHKAKGKELEDLKTPPSTGGGCRLTWIGHASVLVQMEGMSVLADPIFSEYAGPIQIPLFGSLFGYKRYRPVGLSPNNLPKIDAVLISHNHYDHLDLQSVKTLNEKFGDQLTWLVPKGMKSWFSRRGCQNIVELSWWEKYSLPQFPDSEFIYLPAQHWSIRSGFDQYCSLWGSWVISGKTSRFFFAGDTGYNEFVFKEIGRRYGPFSVAAIPIGAYKPRTVMKAQHVDPEEAVLIHKDIQSKRSIGIHWGTFNLTNEAVDEPPQKLAEARVKQGISDDQFITLKHGESKLFSDDDR